MRVHLLALPNAPTTRAFSLDGFAMATIRFATMLKALGHTVLLYAGEHNEAPCDEHISVITDEERITLLGTTQYQHAAIEERSALWQLSTPRIIREVGKRKETRDLLCLIGGASQKAVADAHPDLMCVEYSIGYTGSFAPYRVFESTAWRHCTYGFQGVDLKTGDFNTDGRFFDAVIPCAFDVADFPYVETPEPYVCYLGRLTPRKGVTIALQAATAAKVPLKVIGHGDLSLLTQAPYTVEYLGALDDMATRNQVLAHATAVLCPTLYVEPFCCVAVEAQLCGTPVISTDWGGFTETIVQGVTGFRCTYLGEFIRAIQQAPTLDRAAIRARAVATYSLEAVQAQYAAYFDRLALLWAKGWDTVN